MTVTSPFSIAFDALKEAIDAEFAPEGIVAVADELHEALGLKGPVVGIAPLYDLPMSNDYNVQETWVHIQFFNLWKKAVDPLQAVDPRVITTYAERLRRALKPASVGLGDEVWFFNVERIDYPRDATGNKSRFIATVRCYGRNSQLIETTG